MHRFLPILILVFAAASALIFFFGDSGLAAYRGLEQHRLSLAANVESLKQRNADLQTELASLRNNPERIMVMARSIGLYEPGVEVVKLEGVPPRASRYAVGDLLKLRQGAADRNAIVKAAAMAASVLLLAFGFLSAHAARRREHGGQGR